MRLSIPPIHLNGKAAEQLLDPIITMNSTGIIQSASDSVADVFGWTPTELFGRNVNILIPEPRRSALDRYLDRYRRSDGTKVHTKSRRFPAVRKDGHEIEIELAMSRAELPANAAPFFIGIIRDVSQQIDTGTDATGERARLQRLITEQTRALATAHLRLQLADRLASLGTLAAGLGHDMNNVLLPVRARLDAIEYAGMTPAVRTHLSAVRRSIAYLQHLSDGLHFLALDPDGPGVAEEGEGTTNLSHWWDQVGDLLSKAVPKHVSLRVSFPKGLPDVTIAPHWLTQAVLNLIVNAGESIPLGRRQGIVRVWAEAEGQGRVRISVKDNGRGMAPGIQRRAFDLFFTTKSRGLGTGLGLPLTRKVAIRAGGEIEMHSEPGNGTTVTLVLPAIGSRKAGFTKSPARPRTGMISVHDPRTEALLSHILLKAGVTLKPGPAKAPDGADIWVTEPTLKALHSAAAWRKRRPSGRVVLMGPPSKSSQHAWNEIGAVVIQPVDDFEVIRQVLGQTLAETRRGTDGRERANR